MVNVKSSKNVRWVRRYRIFFTVGLFILFCQIFLAVYFLPVSRSSEQAPKRQYVAYQNVDSEDIDGNSARKSKAESFSIDDEDVQSFSLKSRKNKNSTLHNVPSLRLDELDFLPPCEITTKEPISAIHRAKSQKCKQLISNITCLSMANSLYPQHLISTCPSRGFVAGKELGCFKDEKDFRLLSGYIGINKNENSPTFCMNLCLQSGFPYAGVQYGNECFCGSDEPLSASKLPDSSCNMKCPGDPHATCGGYYTINIYQTGIKKFVPQTANTDILFNSKPHVKIVFLLTLNGRAVRQILRLIKNLYHVDHYYYIHVDVRQDYLFRELLNLENQLPNVRLTRTRFATIWGGASLLLMLRSCMNELLHKTDWNWDFILNLSESDFPVKNITQLTDFLSSNRDRNFVKSHGREVQRFIQKQGLDKTFVECETRMWRVGDRKLPNGIQVDGGSDWVALSRPFVAYVAGRHPDKLITGLLRIFNLTLLPAESFFHTALRNSEFCGTYVDNNLHVTNWKRKLGCKCQYKHIVDWCGCSPNNFRMDDWPRIQNTLPRQLFFARKFESVVSQSVILQLELWLHDYEKPTRFVQNLHAYWQNIYHHLDLGATSNDALLTLSNSLNRRIQKLLSHNSCNFKIQKLLKITSYHYKDSYKYSLFYVNTSVVNLEIAIAPYTKKTVLSSLKLWKHIELLHVSSDYDQKELLSRNFERILSPYTDPVLVYQFANHQMTHNYNMTCLWIDPTGQLHDINYMLIEENSLSGHVKPSLKQPHLPGNWTVKIVYKANLMMEITYFITPLEFFSGNPISSTKSNFIHKGSPHSKVFSKFDKFLPSLADQKKLEAKSAKNSNSQGTDLLDWIDSLTKIFYKVVKFCAHVPSKSSIDLCGRTIESCVNTSWSSFAPDPKSAITAIDNSTKMFNIW